MAARKKPNTKTKRTAGTRARGRAAAVTLAHLSKICLALPETTSKQYGSHTQYLVGKKTFAYFLDDHHRDGIVGVTMKAAPGENTRLIARDASVFYMPAYVGVRGWVAMRLDTARVDWDEVALLVRGSYLASATKKLVALATAS